MPIILKNRQPDIVEQMDRSDCDRNKLFQTYSQFRIINRLLSQWKVIYKRWIRPKLSAQKINTFLDIGFGGGDISLTLADFARQDGFSISITAVDTDSRALQYIQEKGIYDPDIKFIYQDALELAEQGETFDFIISNHLLHHLPEQKFPGFLSACETMAEQRVIFNDIHRSDFSIPLFWSFTSIFFRNSFIKEDGIKSIRKSFTQNELKALHPQGWYSQKIFPFRLLLMYDA